MAAPVTDEELDRILGFAPPQNLLKADSLVDENKPKPESDVLGNFDAFLENLSPAPKPNPPSAWGDVLRGIDNLQSMGGGLAAVLGNASGLTSLEDWGMEVYDRNQRQAQLNPAAVGSFENIDSPGDVLTYAREAVLENLAMFAPSMVTGGIGAVAARKAAETIVKNMAAEMTAEQVAKLVAKRVFIGSTLGAYASSAGMEIGSIYGDTVSQTGERESGIAIGAGLAAGLLDALPEGKLLTNILGPKLGAEVAGGLVRRLGAEGAKQFLREAPTEGLQTIIEEAATVHADPKQDLFSSPRVKNYIDAFAKGGLAGGVIGAVGEAGGTILRPHPSDLVREREKDLVNRSLEQAPLVTTPEEIDPADQRISEIHQRMDAIDEELGKPETTTEQKSALDKEKLKLGGELLTINEQGLVATPPLVNENNAPPAEEGAIIGFQTSKGSTYEVQPDATTIRNKAARPEHPGDEGLKAPSEKTVYLTPEQAQALARPEGSTRIFVDDKGKVTTLWRNPDTKEFGASAEARDITPATEPAEGLIPLELWQQDDIGAEGGIAYKSSHFGSPIVSVTRAAPAVSPTATVVSEEATPTPKPTAAEAQASMVASNKQALEEERAFLVAHGKATGLPTNERTSRIKEIDALLADEQKLNTLSNAPTFAFPETGPLPEGLTKEKVDAKREEVHGVVDSLVDENIPGSGEYLGAVKGALEPHMNFIAGNDIKVKRAPKGKSYTTRATPSGGIEILIPSQAEWEARNAREVKKGGTPDSINLKPKIVEEEVIHTAWYKSLRDNWIKGGKRGGFDEYVDSRIRQIGERLKTSYRGLPKALAAVYLKNGKEADDFTVGTEFLRMMVQRARTGKITEDVAAMNRAAKGGGRAETQVFKLFVQALQRLREIIARYLNPETSTKTIQEAYRNINEALDQYGIIRPEPTPPVAELVPKVDATPDLTPVPEPRVNEEAAAVPTPSEAEAAARETLVNERNSARAEERSGLAQARTEFQQALRIARDNIDRATDFAPQAIQNAAVQHARIQMKNGARLATKVSRATAKQSFETALQRPVTQKAYDEAIPIARENPIRRAESQALPESNDPNQIGEIVGVKYDGTFYDKLWQFTNYNIDQPSYGATFYVPIGSSAADVAEKLAQKNEEFAGGPTLGESGRSPEMEELDRTAGNYLDRVFSPTALVNERSRPEVRGSQLKFNDFTPQEMEYMSQPKDPSFFAAREFMVSLGGISNTSDFLLRNPEVQGTPLIGAERSALYQLTMIGLERMRNTLREEENIDFNENEADRLLGAMDQIERQYAEVGTEFGQWTSNTKGHEKFMTGRRARKDYVSAILQGFKKFFRGSNPDWMESVASKLNNVAQNAVNKVVTRPEAIAFFRKVLKDLNNPAWRKEMKKTIAKKSAKVKGIARKAASRAAQLSFGDFENEPALREAVRRILGDMTFGMPRKDQADAAHSILSAAISEVTREVAREEGAIPERPARTKVAELQKLSEIIRNPDLYNQFILNLEERMVNKFGGEAMGANFNEAIARFVERMRSRAWMEGLLESVVNEKMREMKVSLTRVAQQTYGEGKDQMSQVRSAVIAELEKNGVTDPEILNGVAEDLDAMMSAAVESAREKWVGTPGAVQKSLREIGQTVAKVARSGFVRRDEIAQKMAQQFIERLGLSDTDKFAHATRLKEIIQTQLHSMVAGERQRIIRETIAKAAPDLVKKAVEKGGKKSPIEKIIEFANLGAVTNIEVYAALADKLGLPPYSEETAFEIQEWGERIGDIPTGRDRTIEILKLRNFIESRKGVAWSDMLVAAMYASMLSGPSTQAVNAVSNAFNLLGMVWVEAIRNPFRIPALMRALFTGLTRGGRLEFMQTLSTGLTAGKLNPKVEGGNPLEYEDPVYLDKKSERLGQLLSLTRAKYVVRLLQATDMMFYKAAQEVSFAAKTGYLLTDTFSNHVTAARAQMVAEGADVDTRAGRRNVELRALEMMEQWRADQSDEARQAWEEAHGEALTTTFNQEPKGWIGKIATMIANFTSEYPAGKLLIPFTRVVANVLNTQIEWSPFGLTRWAFSKDFKIQDLEGNMVRDNRILVRSITSMFALGGIVAMLAKYDDDEDPWFTIYGSGPRDANKKRQLYERGWKPNTIKIGNSYISYLPTIFSLSFASLGTVMDKRRDDPDMNPLEIVPQMGLAFVQGTLNQSFLTGIADLFAAFESSDPETKVQRFLARTLTIPIPNLAKQLDAWIDPGVQQSSTFVDMVIKQVPVARQFSNLKPMLNVFGQPIERVQGPLNIPFSNRFITMQKTDDPVFAFLGEHSLSVPGYSKQTKLGDKQMTEDQFYGYVEKAGPLIRDAIRREIPVMRGLTKEEKQDRINDIAEKIKRQTKAGMR